MAAKKPVKSTPKEKGVSPKPKKPNQVGVSGVITDATEFLGRNKSNIARAALEVAAVVIAARTGRPINSPGGRVSGGLGVGVVRPSTVRPPAVVPPSKAPIVKGKPGGKPGPLVSGQGGKSAHTYLQKAKPGDFADLPPFVVGGGWKAGSGVPRHRSVPYRRRPMGPADKN